MIGVTCPFSPKSLAGLELFLDLSPSALADVAASARVQQLGKGARVFTQGQPAHRCHAVISGCIRVEQSGEEGGRLLVRFIGPGQMFGTIALFTDRHYPADAVTVVESVEVSWTEGALLELIHRHPRIAINLVRVVGARLREAQERLREIATQRVDQRIAHTLLRLADLNGHRDAQGMAIDFPIKRQDIAEMCGATLHTASRVLTAWEKAGYIRTDRKRLSILNLAQIRRLAGEQVA